MKVNLLVLSHCIDSFGKSSFRKTIFIYIFGVFLLNFIFNFLDFFNTSYVG